MTRSILLMVLFFALVASSQAQDSPFTITRPNPGDTLVLSTDKSANEIYIDWTVVPGTERQAVSITLQQGENLETLETVENFDGLAVNNGSYIWNGSDSVSLASGDDPTLARTGCNYTIRLSVDGLVGYSQYFAIVNEGDGPVPDSTTYPVEQGIARPQLAAGSDTVMPSGAAGQGDTSGNRSGISSSTLAVAIVVPIVILLIAFGLLLWFGVKRGLFVKLTNRLGKQSHLTHENTEGFGNPGPDQRFVAAFVAEKRNPAPKNDAAPQELHSDHRPWEAEVNQVYQLEGDERDARFASGHMRGR